MFSLIEKITFSPYPREMTRNGLIMIRRSVSYTSLFLSARTRNKHKKW